MEMRKDEELADRLLKFTVLIIQLCGKLPDNSIGNHIRTQLQRCGTSPGANYEEARGAESKADFIHKLGVVLKELKESRYWLKVILSVSFIKKDYVLPTLNECEELIAIIAKSIFTARRSQKVK